MIGSPLKSSVLLLLVLLVGGAAVWWVRSAPAGVPEPARSLVLDTALAKVQAQSGRRDWTLYGGDYANRRWSELAAIDRTTVRHLTRRFTIPTGARRKKGACRPRRWSPTASCTSPLPWGTWSRETCAMELVPGGLLSHPVSPVYSARLRTGTFMRALVKDGPRPGTVLRDVLRPLRAERRAHSGAPRRCLRHRPPHLGMGQLGQPAAQAAGGHRPRVRGGDRRARPRGRSRRAAEPGRPGDGGGSHRLRPLPAMPARCGASLPADPDHRGGPRRGVRRVHRHARLQRHAARRHPHRGRRHHGSDGQRGAHRARGPGARQHRPRSGGAGRSAASRSGWHGPPERRW